MRGSLMDPQVVSGALGSDLSSASCCNRIGVDYLSESSDRYLRWLPRRRDTMKRAARCSCASGLSKGSKGGMGGMEQGSFILPSSHLWRLLSLAASVRGTSFRGLKRWDEGRWGNRKIRVLI